MMSQEANDLITRVSRKDPCGKLMRKYWQPAALVDELQGERPVRPLTLLGEKLVLRTRAGQEKAVTADFFPAYDEDGGLLVAITPRG